MASTGPNSERRKEQNRRAQANLRRKQQERFEDLQRQVSSLKAQLQVSTERLPQDQHVEYEGVGGDFDFLQEDNYGIFQYGTGNVSGYRVEESLPAAELPTPSFNNPFMSKYQKLLSPSYPSSRLPATTELYRGTTGPAGPTSIAQVSQNVVPAVQQRHCAFDALAKNAALLGITPESFLSASSGSNFYSPLQSLASISTSIQFLPPEFHPTMAQLSYPHQPWIDCIPLRDLRSRIIFAVSHRPPFLDTLEVWHDVLSDGLTCLSDPTDAHLWTMSSDFVQRWQMLLSIDLMTLERMCLTSNPPIREIRLSDF